MVMSDNDQDRAITIVGAVLGGVTLILLLWIISLQAQLSKIKKLVKKLSKDELRRRGYEEYHGQKNVHQPSALPQQPVHQPQSVPYQDTRPPLQSQYPANQYPIHGQGPSSSASSVVRGHHEYTPPNYQNQGYDRRDRGFSPTSTGIQVLPRDDSDIFQDHRGNFVLKSPPNKYMSNEVKDFAKDVAKDVATDLAKDGIKDGWNKMWG